MKETVYLDVMGMDMPAAEKFLADLQAAIRKMNVYRNHVLSIQQGEGHRSGLQIKFHTLPQVKREDIILPEGLLNRIERNTIGFGHFSKELLAAGRHLKRGILFYGPPGTGKTLSAMYLASAMADRTILLLTGRSLALIQQSCALARSLQPAMVVLEDVDLVAEERTRQQGCATPLLFELLNEMDGLSADVDVIFLLTTNRAEILEPALAARPGRVDQAFEIPLPDDACRRRLFDLYAMGLTMQVENVDPFIKRTEGASAAFMCELLRKSALFAAEDGLPIVVKDKHIDEALRELVISGGTITRSLLGFQDTANQVD
jgi:SpoVK/Ycf46/Vps4 family AAA+-type ATPase